jgi:hypothetical protein
MVRSRQLKSSSHKRNNNRNNYLIKNDQCIIVFMGSATGAAELEMMMGMSKTLKAIEKLPHVAHVDDERELDQGIHVVLHEPFCFINDPGCGSRCFDTVAFAKAGTKASEVYKPA